MMRLMRHLVVLKDPERFQVIICHDCPCVLLVLGSLLESSITVSAMCLEDLTLVRRAVASVNVLQLALVHGD